MSRRLFAWRAKPSEAEDAILARAAATHMLVVSELGPTQFIIKEADNAAKHKVQVGERQQCACNKSKAAPLCVHIVSTPDMLLINLTHCGIGVRNVEGVACANGESIIMAIWIN
jgi:hypothetical protein